MSGEVKLPAARIGGLRDTRFGGRATCRKRGVSASAGVKGSTVPSSVAKHSARASGALKPYAFRFVLASHRSDDRRAVRAASSSADVLAASEVRASPSAPIVIALVRDRVRTSASARPCAQPLQSFCPNVVPARCLRGGSREHGLESGGQGLTRAARGSAACARSTKPTCPVQVVRVSSSSTAHRKAPSGGRATHIRACARSALAAPQSPHRRIQSPRRS